MSRPFQEITKKDPTSRIWFYYKNALKFDKVFWNTDVQYFGIATEPKGRWNLWLNYRTFSEHNILLVLSVGAYAAVADKMSASEITKDALSVLKSVWGKDVSKPSNMLYTNWSQDEDAFGAYSYPEKSSFHQILMGYQKEYQAIITKPYFYVASIHHLIMQLRCTELT